MCHKSGICSTECLTVHAIRSLLVFQTFCDLKIELDCPCFTVYEDATPEQFTNVVFHYMSRTKAKFVPISESAKVMEQYLESKK